VIASRDGLFVGYFSGDGMVHMEMNGYRDPLPADARRPGNLVGHWEVTGMTGDSDSWDPIQLMAPGILTGAMSHFGALPPVPLRDSAWWWQDATSTLTLNYRLAPVEGLVVECRMPARVTVLTGTELVGQVSLAGDHFEVRMRRRAMGPFAFAFKT
jgi:hypothetical protein